MAWRSGARRYLTYRESHSLRRRLTKLLGLLVVGFLAYHLITTYLIGTFRIESESMMPSYLPGDGILVSPLPYGLKLPVLETTIISLQEPQRGDVVLVRLPYGLERSLPEKVFDPFIRFVTLQQRAFSLTPHEEWQRDFVIRRVIAIPGDTVRIRDFEAFVRPLGATEFINERSLSLAKYNFLRSTEAADWEQDLSVSGNLEELTLQDDEYFVLGDNRALTLDSRHWGPLSGSQIYSRVLNKYWSTAVPEP